MKAVIDASSLMILARVDALETLSHIYGPVAVTDAVFSEVVVEGKKLGKTDAWLVEAALEKGTLSRVSLTSEERALVQEYRRDYPVLGRGEWEAMACAEKRKWLLIVEERKARALARIRSLRYTIAQTVPVEGYLAGKVAYDDAILLLKRVGAAMNTDPAVLNALTAALAAVEEARGERKR